MWWRHCGNCGLTLGCMSRPRGSTTRSCRTRPSPTNLTTRESFKEKLGNLQVRRLGVLKEQLGSLRDWRLMSCERSTWSVWKSTRLTTYDPWMIDLGVLWLGSLRIWWFRSLQVGRLRSLEWDDLEVCEFDDLEVLNFDDFKANLMAWESTTLIDLRVCNFDWLGSQQLWWLESRQS